MVIPVHIWAYALRIWLAAVVALYIAFWLQLEGASSAAVTVAILAQPTRGAALAKAANRIAATLIGATMSVVIAGRHPGGSLCAISVSRVGDPDRRSICCRSPRIEINVCQSSTGGGGPVRLHPRVSHSIFDLSDRGGVLNCCEL